MELVQDRFSHRPPVSSACAGREPVALSRRAVGAATVQERRRYGPPQTPFERVRACPDVDAGQVAELTRLRDTQDPFVLAARIVVEE